MELTGFEKYFDAKILKRGKQYYQDDAVLDIKKTGDEEFTAEVEGSDIYEVTLNMDEDGDIYDISCDCPYDMGEYCKHEAAVLYAMRDRYAKFMQPSVQRLVLPQLLEKCSRTELAGIILEHAREDRDFANYLSMKLSDSSDANGIISDFKHISDTYFAGFSNVDPVLKAGELLVDKTDRLPSSVDKVSVYAEILSMLASDIEEASEWDDEDEEPWELFETINDCSDHAKTAVADVVKNGSQADVALAWESLLKHWRPETRIK